MEEDKQNAAEKENQRNSIIEDYTTNQATIEDLLSKLK